MACLDLASSYVSIDVFLPAVVAIPAGVCIHNFVCLYSVPFFPVTVMYWVNPW